MESTPTLSAAGPAPHHVVGIGASAGGLEALERFFSQLPEDTGMAFVVVQHLSPDFKSLMDELLARHTSLPIALVEDGVSVAADHVYLIPPNKEMIISGGKLLLSERDRQQELTLPIDVFFRSLARDFGSRSIAVVLSGGGSDGSRGAREIHAAGGIVMVQDVASAQFDGMPKAVRDAGFAHLVLAPGDMPRALLEHAAETSAPARNATSDAVPAEQGLEPIYRMLQAQFGIDFTHYKPSTVTRRIDRRLALAQSRDIAEYVDRLQHEHEELDVLYHDLLIGVTRFFRDDKAYKLLESRVMPELLQQHPEAPLRVWVAGCATGEEAYSLAISFLDLMLALKIERPIKIFATDVHRGSLERAARGIYDRESVANVTPERLERYFLRAGDAYQVVPELRQMVVFANHNVIKDAPFTRVDLISCRNLLIYLQPFAQQKALSLFHFSLNRGGTLFLGPSETTGSLGRDFETVDNHWRIYRKHKDIRLPVPTPHSLTMRADVIAPQVLQQAGRYSLTQLLGTYDALLDEIMPPSLLVTDRGELIQSFSGASRLLRIGDGRQDLSLFDLVSGELKMVLVGGLKRALSEPSAITFKGVHVPVDNREQSYKITLRRIRSRNSALCHVLISFEASEPSALPERTNATEIELDQVSRAQLAALESELSHTKENLQAAIEELETSNEELQASNEELQASNEELQSTNEELQSVNEELYTVNSEYQRKIAELTELTNDMDNLLSSTEIGTIFLDRQLKIRKFTPKIAEAFALLTHDVGRSIATFAHRLDHPELLDDLQHVLDVRETVERELRGADGKVFFLRILPYRIRGSVDGVVLTLIDVSGLKAAEDALFHERYLLNSLLFSVPDAIYFKDARGRFIRANHAMARRLGIADPREIVGKAASELANPALALALHEADAAVLRSGETQHYKLEQRTRADGARDWDLVTRLPLRGANAEMVGLIVIFRDVSEQKFAEEKIQEAVRRRDQFLAMLSHELRNPLGAILSATNLLKTDERSVPSRDRFLPVLERQSQHMARLLDDLLEASRVTQNKIELRRQVIDVRDVAREAAEAVRSSMSEKQLDFSLELPPEPVYVDADATRLQQVQVNLLANAAKYTAAGGAVKMSLAREKDAAVVRVNDTGLGLAPDMLESVFELFVQGSRTLDRAAGGLGVGLTLARSLVTLHGGTICACSDGEGKGSSFIVHLPLSAAPPMQAPAAGVSIPRAAAGTKLLVVEDNADARDLLCELLGHHGFECHPADNGATALELLDEIQPNIAILDVGLPGMDGFELARRIRSDAKHAGLHLIALTGYGRESDFSASRAAGFDQHLVKPVDPNALLKMLATMQGGAAESSDA